MAKKKLLKKSPVKTDKITTAYKTEKDPQIELLKFIVEGLINKQAVPIMDLLSSKKPVNEFTIAEKLGLTINQTRNILYKLSDFGLVSFTRKKDKRKGWYIYFWYLNTHQSLILLEENLCKKRDGLRAQLHNRQSSRYYICRTCSIEVNEESALLNNFTCPECTGVYELVDNSDHTNFIEKEIEKVEKEIVLVSEEVKKQREKNDKAKGRKIVREERERQERRKVMREEKKFAKKKAIKDLMKHELKKKLKSGRKQKSKKAKARK